MHTTKYLEVLQIRIATSTDWFDMIKLNLKFRRASMAIGINMFALVLRAKGLTAFIANRNIAGLGYTAKALR